MSIIKNWMKEWIFRSVEVDLFKYRGCARIPSEGKDSEKVNELTQEEISQLIGMSKDRIMDEIINAHMCGQVCAGLDPSYFDAKKHVEGVDLFKRD